MKYYIPEWDDQVDSGYDFANDTYSEDHFVDRRKDVYMWEIFRKNRIPFDGILVSLMSIDGNGKKRREIIENGGLHEYLRLPTNIPIMADCGAWGYIKEDRSPFDAIKVLDYYKELGVQEAVTVDHLVIPQVRKSGKVVSVDISERMRVTLDNGIKGFEAWKKRYEDCFDLLVSVQGLRLDDYMDMYWTYLEHGITSFAFGGLAKKPTDFVARIIERLVEDIKHRNDLKVKRIHFFGLGRTSLFSKLRKIEELGTHVSFDTASWLRRAWLGGGYYHVDSKGLHEYTAIRVPMSDTGRSSFKGKRKLGPDADLLGLRKAETECLRTLRSFERNNTMLEEALLSVKQYDTKLLEEFEKSLVWKMPNPDDRSKKMSELLRFFKSSERRYEDMLRDRPWTKCDCPICRSIGIEAVLFRGNDRNRRRGFHNVYTMYHKFLSKPELWKYSSKNKEMETIKPEELLSLTGKVVVITGCTKTKMGYDSTIKAKAADMYQGRLFKAVKRFSESKGFPLMILSAKYGLVSLDEVIEGYEKTLRKTDDVDAIRQKVNEQMPKILPRFEKVLVIAGEMYRKLLRDLWDERFVYVRTSGYADFCRIIDQAALKATTSELETILEKGTS